MVPLVTRLHQQMISSSGASNVFGKRRLGIMVLQDGVEQVADQDDRHGHYRRRLPAVSSDVLSTASGSDRAVTAIMKARRCRRHPLMLAPGRSDHPGGVAAERHAEGATNGTARVAAPGPAGQEVLGHVAVMRRG
jgi:hypothetical protein